ncbi:hypothetical protein [Acidiphilium sp. C61]|jgi:hypothetical protein|uniref:hypothetical protein n=1 Tax=Acidiphilium sp. C61 TaxID=1671485 RepID=UPI00157A8D3F|nr:hypothetical protein [Acidiphilium sp. C61]
MATAPEQPQPTGAEPDDEVAPLREELLRKSRKIAASLEGHKILTDDDLYDENGLPFGNDDVSQTGI